MFYILFFIFLLFKDIGSGYQFYGQNHFQILQTLGREPIKISDSYKSFRIAIKDPNKKWLNRTIPFLISETFSAQNKLLIEKALTAFSKTCVKFESKKPKDADYVYITEGKGCNSPVGRQKGRQDLTLGEGCLYSNTIIHELMHSIGFFHEHQRYDRDKYLIIHKENIKRGMEFEFDIKEKSETTDFGFGYDYNSIMQYEGTAFSKNGRPTMEPRIKDIKLGPIDGLSHSDVNKINEYYECVDQIQNQNQENVSTFDSKLNCPDLKWVSFDDNIWQKLWVFGGNDSFGNRFYVCRASIDDQLIGGHMFDGICYVLRDGLELEVNDFQVLTHSTNGYKWQLFRSNQLPPNAVITGNQLTSLNKYSIGRCLIKYSDYVSQVVGTVRPLTGESVNQLFVAFNGIQIKCNEFEVLLCGTTK